MVVDRLLAAGLRPAMRPQSLLVDVLDPEGERAGHEVRAMKPTSVIISDHATISIIEERLRRMGAYVEREFFDTLEVGDCVLGVDGSGAVLSEYEADEVESFRSRFGEVGAILFEYDSLDCLDRVIHRVTQGLQGVIDDNSGSLREFL